MGGASQDILLIQQFSNIFLVTVPYYSSVRFLLPYSTVMYKEKEMFATLE